MADTRLESTLDRSDPGDDVFRRFRYQATYAAILAVRMVQRESEIAEVFCEHHNDILLKLRSGRFFLIQVKTQQPGALPFKSSDEEIRGALAKFVGHERTFGDLIDCYGIATNHQFFAAKDNAASLFYLIDKAKTATGSASEQMDKKLSTFTNSLLKIANKGKKGSDCATRADVLAVLKKLQLNHDLPKLQSIHRELREVIVEINEHFRVCTYADLERAASALSYMTYMKSSLPSTDASYLYLMLARDPKAAAESKDIVGKRVRPQEVLDKLSRAVATCTSLAAAQPIDPATIPADLSTAEKKLTAGGLSATTVAAAADWQASAEYLARQWAGKYGEEAAYRRYNHVATAVQTACAHAHEATRRDDVAFGAAMLSCLKQCLARKGHNGTNFFDCQEEHLLGHAIIRTGQCKVWWSNKFALS